MHRPHRPSDFLYLNGPVYLLEEEKKKNLGPESSTSYTLPQQYFIKLSSQRMRLSGAVVPGNTSIQPILTSKKLS